jgi:hypothetical protein
MSETKENKVVVFSDTTGRLLIGKQTGEDKTHVFIEDPQIIQPQDRGDGNLAIGYQPYVWLEMLNPNSKGVWSFPKALCVFTTNAIAEQAESLYIKIVDMYNKSRLDMKASEGNSEDDGKVISMVD